MSETMTDEQAFLAAIVAAPDDDGLRLAYADWLEGRGETARVEFIRVQCEFEHTLCHQPLDPGEQRTARSMYCDDSLCLHCELDRRANGLLWEQSGGITRPFTALPWLPPDWPLAWEEDETEWEWRRGFVDSVTLSAAAWLSNTDALMAAAPIAEVTLSTWPEYRFKENGRAGFVGSAKDHWIPRGENLDHSRAGIVDMLLRAEWPRVKVWTLPDMQWPRGLPGLSGGSDVSFTADDFGE